MKWKVNYNSSDGIIEVIVRDFTGKKVDKIVFNQSDVKAQGRAARLLYDKYGVNLCINKDELFEF